MVLRRVFYVVIAILVDIVVAVVLRVALIHLFLRLDGFLAVSGDLLVLRSGIFFLVFVMRVGGSLGWVLFG